MRSQIGRWVLLARDTVPWALCLALAGCTGSSTPKTSSPLPATGTAVLVSGPAAVIRRDIRTLRGESYSADYHTGARMPDGTVLVIFHSVCTGSTDGHCQAIEVFEGAHRRPLWQHEYAGVLSIHTLRTGFSVRAVHYAPHDPLCCPSLPPVTNVYIWTGSGLIERGSRHRT
jgi:hypothetical protein